MEMSLSQGEHIGNRERDLQDKVLFFHVPLDMMKHSETNIHTIFYEFTSLQVSDFVFSLVPNTCILSKYWFCDYSSCFFSIIVCFSHFFFSKTASTCHLAMLSSSTLAVI